MATFTVSEHGFKKALKLFSPSRGKRIRIKTLNRGRDFMIDQLIANSRIDTTKYVGSWRRRGSGLGKRSITNIVKYAKYVTAPTQTTTTDPQDASGERYIALMTRKFRPEMRRIMLAMIREEYR